MGVPILVYEVKRRWHFKCRLKCIQHYRHLRRKFKKKSFKTKIFSSEDYKKPFRERNLKQKEWYYLHTTDDDVDIYHHREKEENKIKIPRNEFNWGKYKRIVIRIKEIAYISASGKLYSAWFQLYDLSSDNYPMVWNRMITLAYKKDVELFINWFVLPRFRDDFRRLILSKMNKNTYMEICW